MAEGGLVPASGIGDARRNAVRIVHGTVAGRARFHVAGLRRSPSLKDRLQHGLARWGDIRGVWPSLETGNVLVLFDEALPVEAVVERVVAAVAAADENAPDAGGDRWHCLESAGVAAELRTSLNRGLRSEIVEQRLAANGPNTVSAPMGRSAFEILRGQLESLPVLLLAGAGLVSLLTGGLADAVAILGVLALNAGIGFTVEHRAERTIRSLNWRPFPPVTALRDGRRKEIRAENVVPGDIILLAPGMMVPADARLCQAQELHCDEAMLTGESVPVRKDPGALPHRDVPLGDRNNMLYRGTLITSGTGAALVVATGAQTEIGRLQRIMGDTSRPPTPMEQELAALGRQLTWLSIGLGGAVTVLGLVRGMSLPQLLRTSVALAIAAIPEGLPAVASTTLARGVEMMRRCGVVVRRLDAVETLGAVQVLCFDKTGTLTFNRMSVAAVALGSGHDEQLPEHLPRLEHDPGLRNLLETAALCSEVDIQAADGALSGSATEVALIRLAQSANVDVIALRRERPMTGIRHRTESYRFMTTTHALPDGGVLTAVKGDPMEVLELCKEQQEADQVAPLDAERRDAVRRANSRMAERALRVLGFAYRVNAAGEAPSPDGLIWLGLVGLADPLRPSAGPLVQRLKEAGIHPLILTGDQIATAQAIAGQLGLNGDSPPTVMDRARLGGMSPQAIADAATRTHVFARVSPAEKLQIVQALQRTGAIVGMVGDGFNDSPALKAANVGIAIGSGEAEAARSAAEVVMLTDDLGAIGIAVEQGRAAHANVRRATGYLVGTNASEIGFVLAGTALGLSAPLTAAQLLWINIISDVFPCVGLASEPPDAFAMQRPPRTRAQTILGRDDIPRLAVESGVLTAGALASTAWGALRFGPGPHTQMMGFGSIVLGQLLHAINRRESAGTGSNPLFAITLAAAFGSQAIALAVPGLRRLLGVVPLGPAELAITIAGGALPHLVNRMMGGDQSSPAPGVDPMPYSASRSFASSTRASANKSLQVSPASATRSRMTS